MRRLPAWIPVLLLTVVVPFTFQSGAAGVGAEEHADPGLSDEELGRVVTYLVGRMLEDPTLRGFEDREVLEATGVVMPEGGDPRLIPAILERLSGTEEGRAVLASLRREVDASCAAPPAGESCAADNRCARYAACSLQGDLAHATDEVLEMYAAEKAMDGTEYASFPVPRFQALDLEGNAVSSGDLAGGATLLVLLAGHCGHSLATLGILQDLHRDLADTGIRIVGVFLNSGDPERIRGITRLYDPQYEIWVYPDEGLGESLGTRLVPTYFYVDAEGSIRRKLVGQKTAGDLTELIHAYPE